MRDSPAPNPRGNLGMWFRSSHRLVLGSNKVSKKKLPQIDSSTGPSRGFEQQVQGN